MTQQDTGQISLSVALTGSGGAGVITAGNMLLEAAARAGLYGFFMRSSGPQIRGGEAAAMIRLAPEPLDAPGEIFDILIAIDWHNIDRFAIELPLSSDSLVIADPAQGDVPDVIKASGARIVELPMKDMAKALPKVRANMIALGAVALLMGLPDDAVDGILEKVLKKRAAEALDSSRAGIAAGAEAAADFQFNRPLRMPEGKPSERWMISGNEAAGMGAVRGGVRFVAAYPITPATEVLEWLSPNLKKVGGALVQAEDELASINMIIGSSYGGTPSLTATSGPGLALMLESIGLAVASEVPIVIVDVMRGGPSTGIPTKSEQSDLNIAVFGLHGDAPHLVVAPTTVGDCLFTTQWAVHLAEALQVPTIVLSDQLLGQTRAVIDRPPDLAFVSQRSLADTGISDYHRYTLSGDVSPMSVPGQAGGQYTADGLEHNEYGNPSSQVADHVSQLNKRQDKITDHDFGDHWADIEGEGELAVITWGSTTGVAREAIRRLNNNGQRIRLIAPRLIAPASPDLMAAALAGVDRALVIELSHSAQFYHYLKGYFELPCPAVSYCRSGPLPFRAGELMTEIVKWSQS